MSLANSTSRTAYCYLTVQTVLDSQILKLEFMRLNMHSEFEIKYLAQLRTRVMKSIFSLSPIEYDCAQAVIQKKHVLHLSIERWYLYTAVGLNRSDPRNSFSLSSEGRCYLF